MWKVLKKLTNENTRESPPNTLTTDIFNGYLTKIGLDTVSHLQTTMATCGDGGESELFFGGDQAAHVVFYLTTIEHNSAKKHLLIFNCCF